MPEQKQKVHALIATRYTVVSEGYSRLLEGLIAAAAIECANSREELLALVSPSLNLLLLDLELDREGEAEIWEAIRQRATGCPVIAFGAIEPSQALDAMKWGAVAYIDGSATIAEVHGAVRNALAGGRYISRWLAEELIQRRVGGSTSLARLSKREGEVFRRLAAGEAAKTIASELALSVSSVATYRGRILKKLGLHTSAQIGPCAFRAAAIAGCLPAQLADLERSGGAGSPDA